MRPVISARVSQGPFPTSPFFFVLSRTLNLPWWHDCGGGGYSGAMIDMSSSVTSSPLHSSASSSQQRGVPSSPSPVPYRERLLDYQPGIPCLCGRKAARWISWSDGNPGRRYVKCEHARDGGCNFFAWFNPESYPFVRQLLRDLRDRVRSLCSENMKLREALSEAKTDLEVGISDHRVGMKSMKDDLANKEEIMGRQKLIISKLESERLMCMRVLCVTGIVFAVLVKCWLM